MTAEKKNRITKENERIREREMTTVEGRETVPRNGKAKKGWKNVMDVVNTAIYDKIARGQCAEGVFSVERVTIGWKIVRHERIAFANNVVKKGIVQVFTKSAGVANATMNTRV